jgi:hypothetical protein
MRGRGRDPERADLQIGIWKEKTLGEGGLGTGGQKGVS